jgi:hypothetical protein
MKNKLFLLFLLLFARSIAFSQIKMGIRIFDGNKVESILYFNMEWIHISLIENQELIVNVNYNIIDDQNVIFLLYDGTNNLENAKPFDEDHVVFTVNKNNLNRANFWIGLSFQVKEIIVEYN